MATGATGLGAPATPPTQGQPDPNIAPRPCKRKIAEVETDPNKRRETMELSQKLLEALSQSEQSQETPETNPLEHTGTTTLSELESATALAALDIEACKHNNSSI